MLRFAVHNIQESATRLPLNSAYLVGSDGVPLRADVQWQDNQIVCAKRADGPAGLALLWPITGYGSLLLETSRLMDREKPYNLPLELVRGRLTRITQKREDWGLFDFDGFEPVADEIDKARALFVEALKVEDLDRQSELANKALKTSILAGEKLSHFHADIFLTRRKQTHAFTRRTIGCQLDPANTQDTYRQRFRENFDYAHLPIPWHSVEPKQGEYSWRLFDSWIEWLAKSRMPIHIGPLVSFQEHMLPDWMAMYETDFDSVRNLIFDHVRRVVERYGNYVHRWDVISGIHAENSFGFTFEQLMEITRVTVNLVKQLAPRAQSVIDLVGPWGEYYARNQRTIPPMLYADMVVQSGVGFDGLGAQFTFGAPADGMYIRDMFQISERLDRLGNFGKPVHVTAVQVPSASTDTGFLSEKSGGYWRKHWDESVQSLWLKEFYSIVLSKPFVESITWTDLADRKDATIATGGLLHGDLRPKLAYKTLQTLRSQIYGSARKPPSNNHGG